ncbi:MAG: hypothetical protein UV63_C0006G0015 [Microgenomates group bacterium GW2011_GWC1_43_11]|uniref:Uncharacterized protein n=2 Tax=Candidatus Gottesmaniibacteriota TaxID=1752720 RepID=A0A0G1LLV1_9BACT|nr:MAG: hypothetical protein UV63_C0006G0015 [Microgenomates group bacterium GW2011_GWC1_43_11]KKT38613.1 MAG: hypothetical protein UW22_C0009G0019 [Candidatus Gottesmanbacteria bacterium GW2011_GWB1_44_11c]KKT60804.1 MAG: hypothetical protein UW52_C0017G0015 [Candidatus Gottesmanbacteria bacterium GW2011_GWA1_44_24b]HCM82278.1 hypothetical protein [Patescibacteria group bacterium]
MKHNNDRDLFLISVFTFITVFLWITFELIKTTKTSTVSSSVQQLSIPISSTIDTDTLNVLNSRKRY